MDAFGELQGAQPYPVYKLKDVVHDQLDMELSDLPKDMYIPRLLVLVNNCEETISGYRTELASRARGCQNPPTGVLRERRNSPKGSILEKYANDCFLLYQFIFGNLSEIDDLFKRGNSSVRQVPSTPRRLATDDNYELMSLKNTVATLQSDVLVLKKGANEMKERFESFSFSMKSSVSSIQHELDSCCSILARKAKGVPPKDCKRLSDGIDVLSSCVSKLENSRIQLLSDVSNVNQRSDDNSRNINKLLDGSTKIKNNEKLLKQDIDDKIESEMQKQIDQSNTSIQNESQKIMKTLDSKVKLLKVDSYSTTNMLKATLDKFADNLTEKLENMNSNMLNFFEKILQSSQNQPSTNVTDGPNVKQTARKVGFSDKHSHVSDKTSACNSDVTGPHIPHSGTSLIDLTESNNGELVCNSHSLISQESFPRHDSNNVNAKQRNNIFKGVIRKKAKSFIITGIDLESDEEGLEMFLEDIGITFKSAKFLYTRRTDSRAAQIVIDEDQAEIIEDPDIWPAGISCRPWLNRVDYRRRYDNVD